jgi:hypothetical protein
VFAIDTVREEQSALSIRLHQSNVFATVARLGATEHE